MEEIIFMEDVKFQAKAKNEFYALWPRLTGDIMEHLSAESDIVVRRHPEFPAAYAASDAPAVWGVVKKTHYVAQIMVVAQSAAERIALDTMRQAPNQDLSAYVQQYTDQVRKLRHLQKCPDEATLSSNFLLSLNGKIYSKHVLELMHAGQVPATFEATTQHICEWDETERVTKRLMGITVGSTAKAPATEELAHVAQATPAYGRSQSSYGRAPKAAPAAAPARRGARPAKPPAGRGGCTYCKGKGFTFWKGHATADCRKKKAAEETVNMAAATGLDALIFTAHTSSAAVATEGVVVLDNAASAHVIRDASLVTDVHSGPPVSVTGVSAGAVVFNTYGRTALFGVALHDARANANLISFDKLKETYHRSYDAEHDVFVCQPRMGSGLDPQLRLEFRRNAQGLYVLDMSAQAAATAIACAALTVNGVTYTPEQVRRMDEVLRLHVVLSHISDAALCIALDNNCFQNCDLASVAL
jgi:hypothetical protein